MKPEMTDMSKVLLVVHLLLLIIHVKSSTDGELYANCNTNDVTIIKNATGTLTEPQNQSFYDHWFNSYYDDAYYSSCQWKIHDSSNKDVLFFHLSSQDIGGTSGSSCNSVYLEISDCSVENGESWLRECGQVTTSNYFKGTTNDGCVHFVTIRTSAAETELSLSWWYAPICSDGIYSNTTEEDGGIQSVTWPWYDGTPDCQYMIAVPSDYIRITIELFTTSGSDCSGDYLEVANADNHTEIWYKFCEPMENKTFYGAGISALITHHRTDSFSSFKLSWEVSTRKGSTQKQRQDMAIGAVVGATMFLVLWIVLTVSLMCCKCRS